MGPRWILLSLVPREYSGIWTTEQLFTVLICFATLLVTRTPHDTVSGIRIYSQLQPGEAEVANCIATVIPCALWAQPHKKYGAQTCLL